MNNIGAIVIIKKDNKFLAISRRHDKTKFGFPGGKAEPNETPKESIVREAKEETSIIINDCELFHVRDVEPEFKSPRDPKTFTVYCYYCKDYSGEPKDSEEGIVAWLSEDELCSDISGAFPIFNKETLRIFKEKYENK